MPDPLQPPPAVQAFFDDFVRAFAGFRGDVVSWRYATPYLAMNADGTNVLHGSPEQVAAHLQQVLDGYRARGVRQCRYRDLEVTPVGRMHLLATLTWELLDEAGGVVTAWRESYTLASRDDGYRITASIDH